LENSVLQREGGKEGVRSRDSSEKRKRGKGVGRLFGRRKGAIPLARKKGKGEGVVFPQALKRKKKKKKIEGFSRP